MNTRPAPPIIIVGAGVAGLSSALALAPRKVLLVCEAPPGEGGATPFAAGGLAAALGASDSATEHAEDTLLAGHCNDREAVRTLVAGAVDAVAWLEAQGIRVALVTARRSAVAEARGRELRLSEVHVGVDDKRALLLELCAKHGHGPEAAAMMGDDLVDLSALAVAGLAVAPSNAHAWVKERVHWRTRAAGGEGAARELCDLILGAQGKADAVLAGFLR